ncbi:MAG: tyrosine-type recombinase/integrase [Actinomycetota bacterium]|nr:tyrosine-type recombinase/integrase [Actinomycetota bacterium]
MDDFVRELRANGNSPATCRSYCYDLLDWFRCLQAVDTSWDRATRQDVRDYVLSILSADNPQRRRRRPDTPSPGSMNATTGKPYLARGYAPATINHRLSVIRAFYDFHAELGLGPVINPVPTRRRGESRRNAHHNPLEPWPVGRRAVYRQKQPKGMPRSIPDEAWQELWAALDNHRDRALFSLLLSSAPRAQELLDMRGHDVDWGGQRVRLTTKGSRAQLWVACSPEALLWLGRYLAEQEPHGLSEPLWWTLRSAPRPLTYPALRAILQRLNARLGTNWTLHDFRHTCAIRMASDPNLTLIDLQSHLRHARPASSEPYLIARPEEVIARVQEHQQRPPPKPSPAIWDYNADDLDVLLGGGAP